MIVASPRLAAIAISLTVAGAFASFFCVSAPYRALHDDEVIVYFELKCVVDNPDPRTPHCLRENIIYD